MNILTKRVVRVASRDSKSVNVLADVDEATTCLTQEDEEVHKKAGQGRESC